MFKTYSRKKNPLSSCSLFVKKRMLVEELKDTNKTTSYKSTFSTLDCFNNGSYDGRYDVHSSFILS